MDAAFQKILNEYQQITSDMSNGGSVDIAKLGRRQSQIQPVVDRIVELGKLEKELEDNKHLLEDTDPEIRSMALDDCRRLESEILNLKSSVEESLLPKDPNDEKNCLVEIRAGAGGDEATLFAAELFRAYGKFAEENKLKIFIVSSSRSEAGGYKEIICEIKGNGAYGIFKYESGVHRVQRVPETEKSGRVHTSTITVAVLPELEEKDYSIDPKA
jgi:peptide chain release factor 1